MAPPNDFRIKSCQFFCLYLNILVVKSHKFASICAQIVWTVKVEKFVCNFRLWQRIEVHKFLLDGENSRFCRRTILTFFIITFGILKGLTVAYLVVPAAVKGRILVKGNTFWLPCHATLKSLLHWFPHWWDLFLDLTLASSSSREITGRFTQFLCGTHKP